MSTILIVDDIATIRASLEHILAELGVKTLTAENGEDALRKYSEAKHTISAIILDVEMPVMDGLEFLSLFADHVDKVPVVVCSSRHQMDIITKAISLGAVDYIMKPFDQNIIKEKLSNLEVI